MSQPHLLLLAAPSRESRDKAAHLTAAAEALGLPARTVVTGRPEQAEAMAGNEAIRFALACSDALALPAARLNARHGCGGLSPDLVAMLADKASGIPCLSHALGLPVLPQCLPRTAADIAHWSWPGRVIVKPTRSAGGWSPRPWGYRIFDSSAAFLHWLQAENLATAFFAEQRQPGLLGPALLQAAVDSNRTEAVLILLTASRLQVVCRTQGEFEAEVIEGIGPRWRRVQYGGDAAPELVACLPRLEAAGAGRGILYLQGVRSPQGLHLIDINLRLSSGWDWMVAAADRSAHRRLLAALLFDTPFDAALPAPATAIDLVYGAPGRRMAAIDHPPLPPRILPLRLTAEQCRATEGGFDKAGAAAAFVTLGADTSACHAEAERFRAGIRLHYATEAPMQHR